MFLVYAMYIWKASKSTGMGERLAIYFVKYSMYVEMGSAANNRDWDGTGQSSICLLLCRSQGCGGM